MDVANSYDTGVEPGVCGVVLGLSGVVVMGLWVVKMGLGVVTMGRRVLGLQVVTWGTGRGRGVFRNGLRVLGKLGRLRNGRGAAVVVVVGGERVVVNSETGLHGVSTSSPSGKIEFVGNMASSVSLLPPPAASGVGVVTGKTR